MKKLLMSILCLLIMINFTSAITTIRNSANSTFTSHIDADAYNIWANNIYATNPTQDECSEITGCVVGAITDGNTGWTNIYGLTTWENIVNGTVALSSDLTLYTPLTYLNSYFYNKTQTDTINTSMKNYVDAKDVLFNNSMKTYVDGQTGGGISWANAVNGTLYLSSNPSNYVSNSTMNKSISCGDIFGADADFCNDATGGGLTWANIVNGTLYLSSNPSSYITDGNTNWDNSYNFITNITMNKTVSCSDIIGGPDSNFCVDTSTGGGAVVWADVINGTMASVAYVDNQDSSYNTTMFNWVTAKNYIDDGNTGWTNTYSLVTNATVNKSVSCGDIFGTDADFCNDANSGGGNIFDQEVNTTSNVTFNNISVTNNLKVETYIADTLEFDFTDDGNNMVLDVSGIGGTNYFSISTSGAFLDIFANPGPSNDYEMFAFEETQGQDTAINFYEGGTGHNRLWSSGSIRVGGEAESLCSNITSNVDCNTATTGADLVVEDDGWFGGKLFSSDWTNITITKSQISDFGSYIPLAYLNSYFYNKTETDTQITNANTSAINWVTSQEYNTNATMNKSVSCTDIFGADADFCNDATGGGLTWANIVNGTVAEMADVLGFNYYNSTNIPAFVTNATVNKSISCSDIIGGSDGDYCADANSGGGTGHKHDQDLNTTNNVDFSEISVASFFDHLGDTDTYFWFESDSIKVRVGNVKFLDMIERETATDYIRLGEAVDYITLGADTNSSSNISTTAYFVGDGRFLTNLPPAGGGVTWSEVTNGTMATVANLLSYTPLAYINSYFYNKTEVDAINTTMSTYVNSKTGGSGISWANAVNGTLALSSQLTSYAPLTYLNSYFYNQTQTNTQITTANTSMKNYVDTKDVNFNTTITTWTNAKPVSDFTNDVDYKTNSTLNTSSQWVGGTLFTRTTGNCNLAVEHSYCVNDTGTYIVG